MKRRHVMPFGAECRDDGTVRFRLWAPKGSTVSLSIEGKESIPMPRIGNGWFEVLTQAGPGTRYGFQINEGQPVPDPASRFQPAGIHGLSEVIDPATFEWQDEGWRGRPWKEAVIYELHVGTFTPAGTFTAAEQKLAYLAELGVTAIELMPVGDFPGDRDWGYDGVLPYAPARCYGRPDDLKSLVQAAHAHGLMVFLDVVYNHFGPEGNYLPLYAPDFFTHRHRTPWGEAINFDGPNSRPVRDYFLHNALYWLEEFHFDGLRLDAVHAIRDDSDPDILAELAESIRNHLADREIHLVLENDDNAVRYLVRDRCGCPKLYSAQWNDDFHHALHVLVSDEADGYYRDYSEQPARHLGRCLAEGFSYQGEKSPYRDGEARGESSAGLPLTSFVSFLQNHDQVGNRAFGNRILDFVDAEAVKLAVAIFLLAPSPPLLFMGEEFGATTPFLFFCDFGEELAPKVTAGRRAEFARFAEFRSPETQSKIPDPLARETFESSKLNWSSLDQPSHKPWLAFYRQLLSIRQRVVLPSISDTGTDAEFAVLAPKALRVRWMMKDKRELTLLANLGPDEVTGIAQPAGDLIYCTESVTLGETLPSRSVAWFLQP